MEQKGLAARTLLKAGSLLGGAVLTASMSESVVEAQTVREVTMTTVDPVNAIIATVVMLILGIIVYIIRHKKS